MEEQQNLQTKIAIAKRNLTTVKQIEKLEKEIARLEKNILNKQIKIEELAKQL
jgi:phosphate uptake regulator